MRFNLPSLKSDIKLNTGIIIKAMRTNCTGTAVAAVAED